MTRTATALASRAVRPGSVGCAGAAVTDGSALLLLLGCRDHVLTQPAADTASFLDIGTRVCIVASAAAAAVANSSSLCSVHV